MIVILDFYVVIGSLLIILGVISAAFSQTMIQYIVGEALIIIGIIVLYFQWLEDRRTKKNGL